MLQDSAWHILKSFGRVVILVVPGSTWSCNKRGKATPGRVKSSEGMDLDWLPESQLKKPPREAVAATTLELANFESTLWYVRRYTSIIIHNIAHSQAVTSSIDEKVYEVNHNWRINFKNANKTA